MRRIFVLIAVLTTVLGLMAAPAAAHEPEVFTDTTTFEAYNPCSGELHTITIDFLVWVYETPDELMVRIRRTGYTSDGFIMAHGKETISADENTFEAQFRDPWNNPDTGESFEAAGRFLEVDGDVVMDDFRLACKSGPTILP